MRGFSGRLGRELNGCDGVRGIGEILLTMTVHSRRQWISRLMDAPSMTRMIFAPIKTTLPREI